MDIETEIFDRAFELGIAARLPVEGERAIDIEQRAEGEFLRKLATTYSRCFAIR